MKKYEVFISHSHKDKKIADAICHYFENEEIKCWIAPRDITPGTTWSHAIAEAIPECKIMLLIFSSYSNMSDQVLREVELAVSEKLIIVPVKIEDVMPTGGMKYYLSTVHWIDVVNKRTDKYLLSLTETIKGFLGNEVKMPMLVKVKTQKKLNSLFIWLPAAGIVLLILGIIFKDSIFNSNDVSLDAKTATPIASEAEAETIGPTDDPTPIPTEEPTEVLTPTPTATIDPNLSLDTVIEIPDIVLRSCVLKTLNDMGYTAKNNIITYEDILRLENLAVVPNDSYVDEAASSAREYISDQSIILKSDVGIKTLEGLQYADNLNCLILIGQDLIDISALSQIHNLEYIDLSKNSIVDISVLSGHSKLTTLILSENSISDVSTLMMLYNLRELFIGGNPIIDIEPIKGLFSLQVLDISGLGLDNLEAVFMLENLTYLNASRNNIGNIAILKNLTNIIDLIIEDCNLSSIYFPNSMSEMSCLHVAGNEIIDSEEFLNFPNLSFITVNKDILDDNSEIFDELEKRGCEILTR